MATKITIQQFESQLKNAEQPFDIKNLLTECMGQVALLEELIRLFKQNVLEFIGNLKVHLTNEDMKGLAFACHKMKSGIKMMKAHGLLQIVEQIDLESKTGKDLKHLNFLYNHFIDEYSRLEKQIDRECDEMKNQ
ncbi:Hpt domain-containing protein [Flagellimonas lutaonensis]|uniref:HPt domain-containing protein n=1 Tax=Flagellimonas lutaonensis TaxID=516051 RepID=A0A0D5YVI7_9FLAO|nr:Hpt domain-containing protein [Allomuricauda lutaonensis]AKA36332.1 hypothetical protein VC82_2777 [Allomuricauda lutaonensis]